MHKIQFRLGLCLGPQASLGKLRALRRPSWIKGPTSKGGEEKRKQGTPKGWFTHPMFEIVKNTLRVMGGWVQEEAVA